MLEITIYSLFTHNNLKSTYIDSHAITYSHLSSDIFCSEATLVTVFVGVGELSEKLV